MPYSRSSDLIRDIFERYDIIGGIVMDKDALYAKVLESFEEKGIDRHPATEKELS